MRTTALLLLPLLALPVLPQKRQKKVTPKDFPAVIKKATDTFAAGSFAPCLEHLRMATGMAIAELHKQLFAAMPVLGEDWRADKRNQQRAANPQLVRMGMTIVERNYKGPGGKTLKVTIHPSSPAAKAIGMGFAIAAHDPKSEIIGYEAHKGLFRKTSKGKRFELQIPIAGKHLIQIRASGMDEDAFFNIMNQAFVDKIAKILGN